MKWSWLKKLFLRLSNSHSIPETFCSLKCFGYIGDKMRKTFLMTILIMLLTQVFSEPLRSSIKPEIALKKYISTFA